MRSPSMSRLNPAFLKTVMWEAQLWFGRPLDKISPATDARNLGCSLLIIQNRDDQMTPLADGKTIFDAAGYNAQMWTVPAGGHGDAIYEDPKGYAARVIKFLDANFGPKRPPPSPRGIDGGLIYIRGVPRSTSSVLFRRSNNSSMSHGPLL